MWLSTVGSEEPRIKLDVGDGRGWGSRFSGRCRRLEKERDEDAVVATSVDTCTVVVVVASQLGG